MSSQIEYTVVRMMCDHTIREVLQMELSEIGFDSFLETPEGFEGSMLAQDFDLRAMEEAIAYYLPSNQISWELKRQPKENWNQLWEQNFPHIAINDRILVRAPFHKIEEAYEMELVIMPKMSFGTGHHATTALVLEAQLGIDFVDKHVLDIGCGTGVLAIMAAKRGAAQADAFDIEPWAAENALENAELNQVKINVQVGELQEVSLSPPYHVALANINKRVILADLPQYVSMLTVGGLLLTSGFFTQDAEEISKKAEELGLAPQAAAEKDNWQMLVFKRLS